MTFLELKIQTQNSLHLKKINYLLTYHLIKFNMIKNKKIKIQNLPKKKKKLITVNKSPFIFNRAKEQYIIQNSHQKLKLNFNHDTKKSLKKQTKILAYINHLTKLFPASLITIKKRNNIYSKYKINNK